ncbi:hypothetical protein FRC02_006732, partial [Tulasnella sp. 418]
MVSMSSGSSFLRLISQGAGFGLPPQEDDVIIAVMGATGSGKSSFINATCGSNLKIGKTLVSETKDVAPVIFTYRGRRIVLIDTPGFDDTHISDTEILRNIATYLDAAYKNRKLLHGLLYLQKITDNRITGMSWRNMKLFHKLCGNNAMKNVILCSTMWDIIDPNTAKEREEDLLANFWNKMTAQGARSARHYGTPDSALNIIDKLLELPPISLDIQVSMAQGKTLLETEAGKWVNKELLELQKKHEKEMEDLEKELQEAFKTKNAEAQAELWAELERLRAEMLRRQREQERLAA